MTDLVPSEPLHDVDGLRTRAVELEARLHERAAEAAQLKLDLAAFKIRYRQHVGLLHEELDELETTLAEAELGVLEERLKDETPRATPAADIPTESRFTSDAVRRLFREVAKAIHPDLAEDEQNRERRHALMIEANRAYAFGDEERLRLILQSWERSPEAVQGSDPESTRLRLERRIAQIEEQLAAFAGDLDELKTSPMWKLKAMVDEAAAKGQDLVDEMVRRLKRDILVTRNRLEAIRWTPDGTTDPLRRVTAPGATE